jgi:hypothetical protein
MTKTVDELMALVEAYADARNHDDMGHFPEGASRPRRAALRSALEAVVKDAERALPKEPPPGLLMSMAIRYDHGLGCPGYYDGLAAVCVQSDMPPPPSHALRLQSTLHAMRQLYEEVSGHGFYTPATEARYAAMRQAREQEG